MARAKVYTSNAEKQAEYRRRRDQDRRQACKHPTLVLGAPLSPGGIWYGHCTVCREAVQANVTGIKKQ